MGTDWNVPTTGTYRITGYGARGCDGKGKLFGAGGPGAIIQGDFQLAAGTLLHIGVGMIDQCFGFPGLGGIGASVVQDPYTPLVVAGGGGGGSDDPGAGPLQGLPGFGASLTTSGNPGGGTDGKAGGGAAGGTGGYGGGSTQSVNNQGCVDAAGGSGIIGANGRDLPGAIGSGNGYGSGGGGGGYSGGGAGAASCDPYHQIPGGGGGGGGSFNSGANPANSVGWQGLSQVTIQAF
jgi:hypothetical protein